MLKMALSEIRGQIQIYPENWINIYATNCYAYALGLDVVEINICESAYQPGTISESINSIANEEYFNYSTLVENLENDLKTLGISYEEVDSKYNICEGEWKIALFVEKSKYNSEKLMDFHFLRQNANGIWFHKNGFHGTPIKKDYLGRIITDPETCDLRNYEYKKCYALRLNEEL